MNTNIAEVKEILLKTIQALYKQINLLQKEGEEGFIVSRNFRSVKKEGENWLVRKTSEEPEQAVAYKTVRLFGAEVQNSTKYEEGFGCKKVMKCDFVITDEPELKPIHFTENLGGKFYIGEKLEVKYENYEKSTAKINNLSKYEFSQVFLGENGSMQASSVD